MNKQIRINLSPEQYGTLATMCAALNTNTQEFFESNFSRARDQLVARYAEHQAKMTQTDVTIEIVDVKEPE